MDRRDFLRSSLWAGMALTAGGATVAAQAASAPYSERVRSLIEATTVIDMLNTGLESTAPFGEPPAVHPWLVHEGQLTADHVRQLRESGINVFAPGDVLPDDEVRTLEWFAQWNGLIAQYPQYLQRIDSAESLRAVRSSGKVGLMLTLQSSFHLRSVADVDRYHALGQRVSQLCHNKSSQLATAGFDDEDRGLSPLGIEVIGRMNRVGMAVDVSHCSDKSTLQALEVSEAPVLFTHAPCRALNPGYPRGKTDDMIRKMAAGGGVIGIPILRFMIRDREPVSVGDFLDHIDHVVQLVGIEHVGIGSDQSLLTEDALPLAVRQKTIATAPAKYKVHSNADNLISIAGINHPLRTYDIAAGLLQRGYSDADVGLILGGNFERALLQIWAQGSA